MTTDTDLIAELGIDLEQAADMLEIVQRRSLPGVPDLRPDLEVLAQAAVEAERLLTLAKEIRLVLGETLARQLPVGTQVYEVPGLPTIRPSWPKDRKQWDSEGLRRDVRHQILTDVSTDPLVNTVTGEQVVPSHLAEAIIDRVEVAVSINGSNIKTGGLREMGLDPDEYCATTKRPPIITIEYPEESP